MRRNREALKELSCEGKAKRRTARQWKGVAVICGGRAWRRKRRMAKEGRGEEME
jgi:hypothetical protein